MTAIRAGEIIFFMFSLNLLSLRNLYVVQVAILVNAHFAIQDLVPRYPLDRLGRNLDSFRDRIAAVVLTSCTPVLQPAIPASIVTIE